MNNITGKHLVEWGYEPGSWFRSALAEINNHSVVDRDLVRDIVDKHQVKSIGLQNALAPWSFTTECSENYDAVLESTRELSKTPTVESVLIMPDACPAGPVGTITVGGVAKTKGAIHPGMHSADICCSMMVSDFGTVDPKALLDAVHSETHFGPGGRNNNHHLLPPYLLERIRNNPFTNGEKTLQMAVSHLGTQGDGNHFAFVGISEKTGNTVLVTHHGSRGFGAGVYKAGMVAAENFRRKLSPETLKGNAWIPFDTKEGYDYWEALRMVREWTRLNHLAIHESLPYQLKDRLWNEHNFVFQDGDSFYHAKGATPVNPKFLPDTDGRMAIPMNMSEPILIVRRGENKGAQGFAPHGAGRMMSRTAHIRLLKEEFGVDSRGLSPNNIQDIMKRETPGLDVRFFCGIPDVSELPSAYKDAPRVISDMQRFDLARIEDRILPYGSIMAGDWESEAPWRKKKGKK